MIKTIEPGTYIVAVSGGVDSVVLLDMLGKQKDLKLIVAHFDHGIRDDSADDRTFVARLSRTYNLPFEYEEATLGSGASEAVAREARYKFLYKTKEAYSADAIITAHHQDDLLETIMLNILRGTGRKGITSLGDMPELKRPLLHTSKKDLIAYAKKHELQWHEDSTNTDTNYLRNWIRHTIIPKLSPGDRQKFLAIHEDLSVRNPEIDRLLASYVSKEVHKLARRDVTNADYDVAKELIANWLRANGIREFDQKIIERIVIGAKTLQPGKKIPVAKGRHIEVTKDLLILQP